MWLSISNPIKKYRKTVYLEDAKAELDSWSPHEHRHPAVVIVICCGEDSALGRVVNMVNNLLAVRVTARHDFTQRATVDIVIDCVRGSNCHLWYSSPCTAGCAYNRPGGAQSAKRACYAS